MTARDQRRAAGSLALAPIGLADIELVDGLLDRLQDYSMKVDGVPRKENGARDLLTATPDGCDATAKYVFAICFDGEPVGLVDMIRGFPAASTAFIGLLAIVEGRQGQGLGRAAMRAVENFARDRLGATTLRLAVVATNPVDGFWRKLGFRETGEVGRHAGEQIAGTATIMEKRILLGEP